MATTVGERDRARGSDTREDPTFARLERKAKARQDRKQERAAHGKPRRSEDAESIAEALEIEREEGERAGYERGKAESSSSSAPAPASSSSSSTSSRSSLPGASSSSVPGVTFPMVLDVAIITADELVNQHRLPIPSRLLAAFILFGALGAVRGEGARPAKAFAWAIVVATFYGNSPGKKPAATSALEALGGFLGGKYGTNNASPKGAA